MEDLKVSWDEYTFKNFQSMLEKIPIVLRAMAEKNVSKKAVSLATDEKRVVIGEKDLVDAFFAETPFGFHGPMKNDMDELNIDYTQYGHPK